MKQHAELNDLFEQKTYTKTQKKRMLKLMEDLGVLNDDDGRFVIIRKIRGRLIRRPRDKSKPREIVAGGRDAWVGWCELKTAPVNEVAIQNTGRVLRDVDADVLAIVEAESRPVLVEMNKFILKDVGGAPYPNIMIIDGNDRRGIDVGIMTKEGFQLGQMRSHVHDLKSDGNPIFSRDCPEYQVVTPSGEELWVLPNHFKSKFGTDQVANDAKRRIQSEATLAIYERLKAEGAKHIAIVGDLNDRPDSEPLKNLIASELKDASEHHAFTDFEFAPQSASNRGIGTYKLGNDGDKIDYLLLSPDLFAKMKGGGLFRKGAWPGKRPKRWSVYPELKSELHAASDHHAIFADFDL